MSTSPTPSSKTEQENRQRTQLPQDVASLNQAFNEFLKISPADSELLARYRPQLSRGAEQFASVFYQYLFAFPATANSLTAYQQQGNVNTIDRLVKSQLQHLSNFLEGNTDKQYVERLLAIGRKHRQFGIEPVWIMGAYRLYLEHLTHTLRACSETADSDKTAIETALMKCLFRDIGLMLQGYWQDALQTILAEQKRVKELQSQVTSILANLPQLLWSVDVVENKLLYVSPTTRRICDIDASLPIPCFGWTLPEDRETVTLAWQRALNGERVEVESRILTAEKELRWFRRVFHPYANEQGNIIRIDGLMEDVSDVKANTDRLQHLAATDLLTGLPNRGCWYDRLRNALDLADRQGQQQVVVMMVDLDHFKMINDSLGHVVGDQLLCAVTERIRGLLRKSDTMGRLGGDEFALLLPSETTGRKAAGKVARNIVERLTQAFQVAGNELYVSVSVGIAVYPQDGTEADELVRRADLAMYTAKSRGGGYNFFDAPTDERYTQRLQLSSALRHALDRDEFRIFYQPKVDMKSGRLVGLEALLRWQHPHNGLLSPNCFIDIAEQSGFINPMTEWVLEQVAEQLRRFRSDGVNVPIAINVSARSLYDSRLLSQLRNNFDSHAFNNGLVEIEVTESVMMADIERGTQLLEKLSELGVSIAIDDYGTGYSSLAYLKKLPIRSVKIDKSFVIDMLASENDAVIVKSTIDLAHNLGLDVIAEGIENTQTWDLLHTLGCDTGQGYHVCRPAPLDGLQQFIASA